LLRDLIDFRKSASCHDARRDAEFKWKLHAKRKKEEKFEEEKEGEQLGGKGARAR
jgi:hypothetical protein